MSREYTPAELLRGETVPALRSADVECWTHAAPEPCPKCQSDTEWDARYAKALRLERQADEIESMPLAQQSDREHLRAFAQGLRREASRIRGECQAVANGEPEL